MVKRKVRRNSKGQFRKKRVITFFKLPQTIKTLTDFITCSYWLNVYPGTYLLRNFDYIPDLMKVLTGDQRRRAER